MDEARKSIVSSSHSRKNDFSFHFLYLWFKERFPPENFVFFSIVAFAFGLFARGSFSFSTYDIFLFLSISSFFLLIRIIDEHKDFKDDLKNHPERVLQSGRVTLRQLRIVGTLAFLPPLIHTFYVAFLSTRALYLFLLTFIWLFLMAKEFFASKWLKKHLFLYALSHMAIIPLAALWWLALAKGQGSFTASYFVLYVVLFCFFGSFAGEIIRKSRGREESKNLESYNRHFGYYGSALLAIFLTCAMVLCALGILYENLGARVELFYFILFFIFLSIFQVFHLYRYQKDPTQKAREKNESVYAMCLILTYTALIVSYLI